ncbi:MAG: glycosyltransferase family 1 protein [Bacteroidia bacterium]|nr:glycosyltransferase family 1 protein [Bacteroidia bacterium]
MVPKSLHIITLNIPYPPDYGGIIDSYYRIKSLTEAGTEIHLHSFEYGRQHSEVLESLCKSVDYYPRNTSFIKNMSLKPYTVASRDSEKLLHNLLKDDCPILFDGLHTTYYLDHPSLSGRLKTVRVHNIEHQYYSTLARFEMNPFKKLYFGFESLKLRQYEKILDKADILLTVSDSDQEYFEGRYHNAELIPSFHPCEHVESQEGKGDFIVYHGDLSVNENAIVAEYLISKIFSKLPYKCVIAGKSPSSHLKAKATAFKNISIIPDPGNDQMSGLIKDAQINLLFTISANGLKLKVLIALFSGRHCLVNSNILKGSMLGPACQIEDSADGIIEKIHQLMKQPFTEQMIAEREKMLEAYSNNFNVNRLLRLIFPGNSNSH